jgi:hypothetical protein
VRSVTSAGVEGVVAGTGSEPFQRRLSGRRCYLEKFLAHQGLACSGFSNPSHSRKPGRLLSWQWVTPPNTLPCSPETEPGHEPTLPRMTIVLG